jgi:hypothetical protein
MKTTESDARKLLPFFTVLFFVPETLPFLMVWSPGFLPSTCMSESQIVSQWKTMAKRRKEVSTEIINEIQKSGWVQSLDELKTNDGVMNLLRARLAASASPSNDFNLKAFKRSSLVSYVKYLGLGHRTLLNFKLRHRLREHFNVIRGDDELLKKEGVDSLSLNELQTALEARGFITTVGERTEVEMRSDLKEWLDLTLNEEGLEIPEALLVWVMAVREGLRVGVSPSV